MSCLCLGCQGSFLVGEAGIEPTTPSLEGSCSIQLSYSPAPVLIVCPGVACFMAQVPLIAKSAIGQAGVKSLLRMRVETAARAWAQCS